MSSSVRVCDSCGHRCLRYRLQIYGSLLHQVCQVFPRLSVMGWRSFCLVRFRRASSRSGWSWLTYPPNCPLRSEEFGERPVAYRTQHVGWRYGQRERRWLDVWDARYIQELDVSLGVWWQVVQTDILEGPVVDGAGVVIHDEDLPGFFSQALAHAKLATCHPLL